MPSPSRRPEQGEIWLADLAPPVGHEQAGPPRPSGVPPFGDNGFVQEPPAE
jgi:hypothetical protein